MFKRSLLSVFLFTGLLGCGGSLDQGGATKASAAALTASQTAESQIRAGVAGMGTSGVKVEVMAGGYKISGSVTSPAGGTATVEGQGSLTAAGTNTDMSMNFMDWKDSVQDLTLNGKLIINNKVTVTGMIPNISTTAEAKYTGDLQVSGSVKGTATFDLAVKTTAGISGSCVTQSGKVSGFTIDVKVGC